MPLPRLRAATVAATILLLAACAGGIESSVAQTATWPPLWEEELPPQRQIDFSRPRFTPPQAQDCRRAPTTREVPGWPDARGQDERKRIHGGAPPMARSEAAMDSAAKSAGSVVAEERAAAPSTPPPAQVMPAPGRRPAWEPVTAGMVDDNADFGEYLAYRQRNSHLAVRDRDVSERTLLEVTDAQGRPVHDAEVAIQRSGIAQPVAWARTDTAGRVWIHPRAFAADTDRALGISVRKGGASARGALVRGQAQAVQVRLGGAPIVARPRLDLVFLVDATGSMDDEIAKLKSSMRAIANQLGSLPGQPDLCYGLVAYRDKGDAFLTRTHDFTDDLGAFQGVLERLRAGGGGDKPEALNEALHETVHRMSWRTDAARFVVLVADAAPHLDYGGPQYDVDMQAALAKGIKIFSVGASGLEPEGEYIYRQIAQYTAGRFVFLTYREASNPGSGPGGETVHDVKNYSVQTLDKLIVRLVSDEMSRLARR
jgi:Mg-chelatase subunit ChlD